MYGIKLISLHFCPKKVLLLLIVNSNNNNLFAFKEKN